MCQNSRRSLYFVLESVLNLKVHCEKCPKIDVSKSCHKVRKSPASTFESKKSGLSFLSSVSFLFYFAQLEECRFSQRGFPNTLSGQMSESCVWLLSVMSKSLLVGQSKSVLSQVRGQVWLSISKSKQSSLMCLFIIRVHHMPPAALVPIFGVCRAGHFLAFPLPNHLLRARPSIGAGVDQDLSHPCLPPRSARL